MESQYQAEVAEIEIFLQVRMVEPPLVHIHSSVGNVGCSDSVKHSYAELFRALHFNSEIIKALKCTKYVSSHV